MEGVNCTNFNREEFIANYDKLKSSRKMAKLYGCCKQTILKYAKQINYDNQHKTSLTNEQIQDIINQYEDQTSTALANKYNVSRSMILKIWIDNGLNGKNRNKYPFNYDYFENIDTIDKAYFLGFLASDGNVSCYKNEEKQAMIRLTLKEEDTYILELFKKCLDLDKPIHKTSKMVNNTIRYYSSLEMVSDKLRDDLKKYNIIPNKTITYECVKLDNSLMSHFIRGYFDGDGSAFVTNNDIFTPSSFSFTITGFKHNLEIIRSVLKENGINSIFVEDKRAYGNGETFGNIVFPNIKEKYNFVKYLYKDAKIFYLHRKKYLADAFIDAINSNYANKQKIYDELKQL